MMYRLTRNLTLAMKQPALCNMGDLQATPTTPWNGEKSMGNRIEIGSLSVDEDLYALVRDEIAPGTGIEGRCFLESTRRYRCGVRTRKQKHSWRNATHSSSRLMTGIWHVKVIRSTVRRIRRFLPEIGYLLPEGRDFTVITEDVDTEISLISGPQLVVPTR